jgi:hypothetical protein
MVHNDRGSVNIASLDLFQKAVLLLCDLWCANYLHILTRSAYDYSVLFCSVLFWR